MLSRPKGGIRLQNLKSLYSLQEKVMRAVNKEVNLGRVTGPFMHLSLQNLKLSPVGMVPKEGSFGLFIIFHILLGLVF